ncbi:hypothetical protein YC2023_035755 [Brassica napus]
MKKQMDCQWPSGKIPCHLTNQPGFESRSLKRRRFHLTPTSNISVKFVDGVLNWQVNENLIKVKKERQGEHSHNRQEGKNQKFLKTVLWALIVSGLLLGYPSSK